MSETTWNLLAPLPVSERESLLTAARPRQFSRGEAVFHEGDPANSIHLIVTGHFSVRITTPQGDVATVRVLGAGGHFGEMALVSGAPRLATVRAVEQAETLMIAAEAFGGVRRRNPAVDRGLVEILSAEVGRLSHHLVEALYVPVPKRIRRRLLELDAMYSAPADAGPVSLPFTQEDIAGLAGTTRPTANKELLNLQGAGLITVGRGRIQILDRGALRRRAR